MFLSISPFYTNSKHCLQIGKEFQFRLGQFLRRRYQKLIGLRYSSDKVYIQSDSDDRNIMSALCTNFGLYPACGDQVWNMCTDWQPIPIHSLPPEKSQLLKPSPKCIKLDRLFKAYLASDEVQSQLKMIPKLRSFIQHHSGENCDNLPNLYKIYDTLSVETLRGLP